jgi:hypothetical protein
MFMIKKTRATPCFINNTPVKIQLMHAAQVNAVRYQFSANASNVGALDFRFARNRACYFDNITIIPAIRGHGVGSCLYNFLESNDFKTKCDIISMASIPERVHFWYQQGYQPDPYAEEHIGTVPLQKYLSAIAREIDENDDTFY